MLTLCELEDPPSFKGVVKVYNNPRALETISELECGHFVSIKAKQVDLPFLGKQPNIIVTYGTLEKNEEKEEEPKTTDEVVSAAQST